MRGSPPSPSAGSGTPAAPASTRGFLRRPWLFLTIAMVLPSLLFAMPIVYFLLEDHRHDIEAAALARTQEIGALVDAQIAADVAALRVIAMSPYVDEADWGPFYERCRRILALSPHWITLILTDAQTQRVVLDLRYPLGSPQPSRPPVTFSGTTPIIGGTERDGEHVGIPIDLPVLEKDRIAYRLTLLVRTDVFQQILTSRLSPGTVGGVVDRTGNFVARNINYAQRAGTPATIYVRDAIASGRKTGIYHSITYENFNSYTAYATSPLSGWSVHIALAKGMIDTTHSWSLAVAIGGGIASVALAGLLALLVARDAAETRRAEAVMHQSQRLEAIGRLTGGIAHDFNNLLTVISGNLQLVRGRADDERIIRSAQNALEAANRAAKLIQSMQSFSRTDRMAVTTVDLSRLLDGMAELLANAIGGGIKLELQIDPEARLVRTDPHQLELAILNLAVNARDAMPEGGTLSIRGRRIDGESMSALKPGDYTELAVRDTGRGMSQAVLAHALEPYYTTKPLGQGTGLGLPQVFGVVRQSGGDLAIESKPNAGTAVRLYLPRAADTDQTETAPALSATASRAGQHTVLVVDDDESVRPVILDCLADGPYRLLDAASGAGALDILGAQEVDLLVTDLRMPGMSGLELVQRAWARKPGLKVLILTGHAESGIQETLGGVPVLHKPFTSGALMDAVSRLLGSGTDARDRRPGSSPSS